MSEVHPIVAAENFRVSSIRFRNAEEYAASLNVRREAFSPWYADASANRYPLLARLRLNALANCFPEFFLEARTATDEIAGWRFCLPTYWNGDVETLGTFNTRVTGRIGRLASWSLTATRAAAASIPLVAPLYRAATRRIRREWLDGCNTMVSGAMLVLPKFRGQRLCDLLLTTALRQAREMGFQHVISALRPLDYGQHKLAGRIGHNPEDFAAYCGARRPDGLPVDPLLRICARAGARFLKPEPRSYTITKPLAVFEEFRRTYKPDRWYEATPGQWECGVTQSWFVTGDTVTSVEPEFWCEFPLA